MSDAAEIYDEDQPQAPEATSVKMTLATARQKTAAMVQEASNEATEPEAEPGPTSLEELSGDLPGRKTVARAGITQDLEAKELPGVVMDIVTTTRHPRNAYAAIKNAVQSFNGEIVSTIWTERGKIGAKVHFGSLENAKKAASLLKTQRPKTRFAVSDHKVSAFTLDGDLLTIGAGDILNTAAIEDTQDGQMLVREGRTSTMADLSTIHPMEGEIKDALPQEAVTQESLNHGQNGLYQPNVEIPNTGVLVQIHLPKALAKAEYAPMIGKYIRLLKTQYLTLKSMQGNVATLYVAGERSPGNVLKKLAAIQNETDKIGIAIVLDYGRYDIVALDDNTFTLQGHQQRALHKSAPAPGKWITPNFKRASEHERNLSAASCRHRGVEETTGLEQIDMIESVEFRPVILGRETVGRKTEFDAAEAVMEDTFERSNTNFLVITGQAGIGKTDFIKRIFDKCEEPEFRKRHGEIKANYYKIMEDGAVNRALAIRKIIEGVLQKADAQTQENFRDLKFFSDGEVPEEFKDQYQAVFEILTTNEEYLGERLTELFKRSVDMLTVDDCQWLDEYSLKTLCHVAKMIPKKSGTLLIFLGRNEEEPLPETLEAAVAAKTDQYHRIDINALKESDIEGCIRAHIPSKMAKAKTIPENFIAKMAEISQGVPLIITEILGLLLEENAISLDGDVLVVPDDARLQALAGANASETLSTIIQAKFARLSDAELEVADYIAVIGEIEIGIFKTALKKLGMETPAIQSIIDSLEAKKIIRKQPKLGFLYDQMGAERRKQTQKRSDLGKRACKCYEIFKDNQKRYPEYITPAFLFKILAQAAKDPSQLDENEMQTVGKEYLPLGNRAIDDCMDRSQNIEAIEIAEGMQPAIAKLQAKAAKERPEYKTAIANYLYGTNLRIARANLRVARAKEAKKALDEIAALAGETSEAQLLQSSDRTTPISALPYYVLRVATAFSARDPRELVEANAELATKIAELKVTFGAEKPELVLAEGELLIGQIRQAGVFSDTKGFLKIEKDEKTAEIRESLSRMMKHGSTKELQAKAHAVLIDIMRQTAQQKGALVVLKNAEGKTGEESLFLQEVNDDQTRDLMQLQEEIMTIIEIYEAHPQLIRDPETYGHLIDTGARIEFLLACRKDGKSHMETAEKLSRKSLRIAQNWKLPQLTSRTRLLRGDFLTGLALRHGKLKPASWDQKILETAVVNYEQGYAEMLRINGEEDPHAVCNSLNGAAAFAMLTMAKNDPTMIEGLKATYARANKTMLQVKRDYYDPNEKTKQVPAPEYREIFLNQMSIIGLLRKAAEQLGVNLQLPPYATDAIVQESIRTIETKRNDEETYSEGDKLFIALRRMGIKGLIDNPKAPAWAVADTEPFIKT